MAGAGIDAMTITAKLTLFVHAVRDLLSRQPKPKVDTDGLIHIAKLAVPLSHYLSKEARVASIKMLCNPPPIKMTSIEAFRKSIDEFYFEPMLQNARSRYQTQVQEMIIGNVRTDVVTPAVNVPHGSRKRVLINLHGGAFMVGAGLGALLESIPVAAAARTKVISIDYRQGPEHMLPATIEDILSVYRELLKEHDPREIGVYGCSAGGMLAAMLVAHLQKERLPSPGAVGMICCSADMTSEGDSRFTTMALCGQPAPGPGSDPLVMIRSYLGKVDLADPLISPAASLEVLSRFPPTLLITGTRAFDLSAAVNTHARMTKAGVDARLHVWEGMWHAFQYDVTLPESQDALDVLVKFFDQHLAAA
jgi:acetyl esterase/lipase